MDYDSDDDYIVDLESDQEEAADSSDDEINIVLHGTPEQRRKLEKQFNTDRGKPNTSQKRKSAGDDDDSSEDEFEKEMTAELNATMSVIEKEHKSGPTAGTSAPSSSKEKDSKGQTFYDKDYFDSDSDEEGNKEGEKSSSRAVLSNDDLLYDPEADDADQTWVDEQRRRYQPGRGALQRALTDPKATAAPPRLPNSDAVLNCPACMIQLCLDCQRHEKYNNQYRAMFVMNCVVNHEQRLKYPKQKPQTNQKKKKRTKEPTEPACSGGQDNDDELYHPVRCSQCNTEVAVFDSDEVFHFFNVLASHS